MKKWLPFVMLITFLCLCVPLQVQAEGINLWSFGTPVEASDGNITFYESWNYPTIKAHDITYSSDGITVKGWILEPNKPGPHPVLIWNRGGSGNSGDISWGTNANPTLYRNEILPYVEAGYAVVCTQYRGNGYVVTNPPTPPDIKSGNDNFVVNPSKKDGMGGAEVNDVINLLPLIEKVNSASGNGGLKMNLDLNRVAMMGMSRGGMETYIALRELSDKAKFGTLPEIKAAIVKGALSHLPGFMKDSFDGKLAFLSGNATSRNIASYILGDPGVITGEIASFFPGGSFPVWKDTDLLNDAWIESGFSAPPSSPYTQVYSEDYYARSAALWKDFWKGNEIPFLILHGKGDTQVLWDDAQEIYNNIIAYGGDASLYTLKLYEDSSEFTAATTFLGTDAAKILHTDHWLVNYDYGRGETLPWLAKQINTVPEPTTMLLLGLGLMGLAGIRRKFKN